MHPHLTMLLAEERIAELRRQAESSRPPRRRAPTATTRPRLQSSHEPRLVRRMIRRLRTA